MEPALSWASRVLGQSVIKCCGYFIDYVSFTARAFNDADERFYAGEE